MRDLTVDEIQEVNGGNPLFIGVVAGLIVDCFQNGSSSVVARFSGWYAEQADIFYNNQADKMYEKAMNDLENGVIPQD